MQLTETEVPVVDVLLCEDSTTLCINSENRGTGTLYISSENVCWINNSGEGITLSYPDISIIAVCTDRQKFENDCIFIMVKDDDPAPTVNDDDDDDDSDDEYPREAEILLAPTGGTPINALFNTLTDCNRLHPSVEDDMVSNEEDDDDEGDESCDDDDDDDEDVMVNGCGDKVPNGNFTPGQFDDAD